MTDAPDLASAVERARWFAALSGPFDPQDALKASVAESGQAAAAIAVAARLATACDTHAGPTGSQWLMRGSERRWDIDGLQKSGRLPDAVTWRSEQTPFDDTARDVVAALRGADAFSPAALEAKLAAGSTDLPDQHRAELQQLAYALEWAGPAAPGYAQLERLRALLNRLDDKLRTETILAHGVDGREDQRKVLTDWIANAAGTAPVKALFVTGLPGIGKSALLEIAIREAASGAHAPLVVRLDFDRPVLDVLDQVGLTLEAARQIAAQLPDLASDMRDMRLKASGARDEELKGRGRDMVPSNLASALGRIVTSSGRVVVMVLDTCEVLRGRGETHPQRLFEWLDQLFAFGLAPMAVIAAGRGDALDTVAARIGQRLDLGGLTPAAVDQILDQKGVPETARADIHSFAKGNPLLLQLASTAVTQPGATALGKKRSKHRSDGLAAAHLYRFLLSRIADPDLRRIADPGLLVRRLNFEVIRDVMAPELGLKRIGDAHARHLMAELELQNWLVERDPMAEGWLRQRPAMRAQLVPLFYASKPAKCAKIDRAAAAWFENRSEPPLAIEALYHRLQLMRRGGTAPRIDRDLAIQFDEATLSELPNQARDRVLQTRGQRSAVGRGVKGRPGPAGPVDPRAVKDLQSVTERGDWMEAADLYARAIAPAKLEPASEVAHAARTFLWRVGRWTEAVNSLRQLDAIKSGDGDLFDLRSDDALVRLEMRAEFGFADLVRRFSADSQLRNRAQQVASQGSKTDMSTGALGFALSVANIPIESSSRRTDPVRATRELWSGLSGFELENALSVAQERMMNAALLAEPIEPPGFMTDPDAFRTTTAARQLAVHSPYASPLKLLAQFDASHELAPHARATLAGLTRATGWWNGANRGGELPFSDESPASIQMLADLGLAAEWAAAAAFSLRSGDLALVAKRSEGWRRVTAGRWDYGRSPPNWSGATYADELDASVWARVLELAAAEDPVASSRAFLVAWTGQKDQLPDKLRARLTTLAARAKAATARRRGVERALAAARALTRYGAPAAFVPALATLAALKQDP
ncbi:AAA family ATPase [uncultured Bradyrhizobium sp.]|uniref:AAA family ATPase n=1 Tax=uncultured Bradyrhizobium sp. TaxID=199684 RepID=UPI0035CAC4A3